MEVSSDHSNKCRKFKATVVPEIRVKIPTSDLKPIVKAFKNSNIPLADKHLVDSDGSIDLLLGIDGAHILPVHSCGFGNSGNLSLLYYCCGGVMLAGDMTNSRANLLHFNHFKKFIKKVNALS